MIKLVGVIFQSFYISMLAVYRNHLEDIADNSTAALSSLARWWLLRHWVKPARRVIEDLTLPPDHRRTIRFPRGSAHCKVLPSSTTLFLCFIDAMHAL